MDCAKNQDLGFRVGDWDLPERRMRYSSRREEEHVPLISCPCDACGNLCDIDGFHELEISEETIAILRDRL